MEEGIHWNQVFKFILKITKLFIFLKWAFIFLYYKQKSTVGFTSLVMS